MIVLDQMVHTFPREVIQVHVPSVMSLKSGLCKNNLSCTQCAY